MAFMEMKQLTREIITKCKEGEILVRVAYEKLAALFEEKVISFEEIVAANNKIYLVELQNLKEKYSFG